MRHLFLLLLFCLAALPAAAQPPSGVPTGGRPAGAGMPGGSVKGRIVDERSGEGLEAATVSLWRLPDSTLATGLLTDQDGSFLIENLRPARYYVSVSYVGYSLRRVNVTVTATALAQNMGDIKLSEDAAQVAEVTVTGERAAVTVEVDRTSYNVADQAVSTGGTASDVLETVPAVEVDTDGNVSLRGSQNVAILINGRPAPVPQQFLAAFLRQIPSNQIERIEVIPNPSARYDPDGLAGMINIVLKSGQAQPGSVSGGLQLGSNTRGEVNTTANINVTREKLSLYASIGARRDRRESVGTTYRESGFVGSGTPFVYLDQEDEGNNTGVNGIVNATVDYAIDARQTLSLQGVASMRRSDRDNLNTFLNTVGTSAATAGFLSRFQRTTDGTGNGLNTDLTLSYRNIRVPSRNELTGELRFGLNRDDDEISIRQDSLTAAGSAFAPLTETSNEDNERRDLSARLDMVRPLWSNAGKVEVGYKGTLRRLDASQDALRLARTGLLSPFADDFRFDENVQAAYLTLGRTLGKFSAQAGLRAEQAWTTFDSGTLGQENGNDYFSLFPSAFLTFTPTIQNSFRVSYSRRIDRPDSRTLNPVASIDDPYSRRVGNPDLKPAYTDAIELGYTRFSEMGSLSLSPFYRRTTDAFERVTTVDPANPQLTNITFANLATNESMGADLNAQLRFGRVASLGGNASLYRYLSSGSISGQSARVDATTWNVRMNGQVTPREGTTLSGFLFYNPPRETTQGRFGGFSRMDVLAAPAAHQGQGLPHTPPRRPVQHAALQGRVCRSGLLLRVRAPPELAPARPDAPVQLRPDDAAAAPAPAAEPAAAGERRQRPLRRLIPSPLGCQAAPHRPAPRPPLLRRPDGAGASTLGGCPLRPCARHLPAVAGEDRRGARAAAGGGASEPDADEHERAERAQRRLARARVGEAARDVDARDQLAERVGVDAEHEAPCGAELARADALVPLASGERRACDGIIEGRVLPEADERSGVDLRVQRPDLRPGKRERQRDLDERCVDAERERAVGARFAGKQVADAGRAARALGEVRDAGADGDAGADLLLDPHPRPERAARREVRLLAAGQRVAARADGEAAAKLGIGSRSDERGREGDGGGGEGKSGESGHRYLGGAPEERARAARDPREGRRGDGRSRSPSRCPPRPRCPPPCSPPIRRLPTRRRRRARMCSP